MRIMNNTQITGDCLKIVVNDVTPHDKALPNTLYFFPTCTDRSGNIGVEFIDGVVGCLLQHVLLRHGQLRHQAHHLLSNE